MIFCIHVREGLSRLFSVRVFGKFVLRGGRGVLTLVGSETGARRGKVGSGGF